MLKSISTPLTIHEKPFVSTKAGRVEYGFRLPDRRELDEDLFFYHPHGTFKKKSSPKLLFTDEKNENAVYPMRLRA